MTETASSISPDLVNAATERLARSAATGKPVSPVRDLLGDRDAGAAYAVQRKLVDAKVASGQRITGRKIGLTSKAVQAQLGVDQPDFGFLFAEMEYIGGDTIPPNAVMQPRAEAEIAFVLREDLVRGPLDSQQIRDAIDYAVAALKVCGSRIDGWDIGFTDTVADNASAGAYVLGPARKRLDEFEPRDVAMTMTIDGTEVSSGSGDACLGDPIEAVVWLARTARDFGEPLRAGQVILSGALGPMLAVRPGSVVRTEISGLGSVTFTLGQDAAVSKEHR